MEHKRKMNDSKILNITGNIIVQSEEGVTLENYDWRSMRHGLDIWFEKNGWSVNNNTKYTSEECNLSFTFKANEDGTIEVGISGTCNNGYGYTDTLERVISIVQNRHGSISGKLVLSNIHHVTMITIADNDFKAQVAQFN